MEFTPFPKIPRLSRDMVITEKIDGTNASIYIVDASEAALFDATPLFYSFTSADQKVAVYAGSRTRWLSIGDDNYGFAKWVVANGGDIVATLGLGHHFGEWWGGGIQRGYGLEKGDKRFSLFNTTRWESLEPIQEGGLVHPVPVLYKGPFDTPTIIDVLDYLKENGSIAAPGFMKPEGIVIFHVAANQMFKKTIEGDRSPKGQN